MIGKNKLTYWSFPDGKSSLYKPQGDAAPRSAGPWGSKRT